MRTYHDAAVDVSERAEAEEISAVLAVVEGVRRRGVDWHRSRVRGGVGHLTRVHLCIVVFTMQSWGHVVLMRSCQTGVEEEVDGARET